MHPDPPVLPRKWPPDPPDPPFHFKEIEDPDWIADLTTLAEVAQLGHGIQNSALQGQIQEFVSSAVVEIGARLPEGIRVGDAFGQNQASG